MALARKTSRNKPKQRLWEYQQLKKAQKEQYKREEERYNNLCGPVIVNKIQEKP